MISDLIKKLDDLEGVRDPSLTVILEEALKADTGKNDQLSQRIVALQYRLGAFPQEFRRENVDLLNTFAKSWVGKGPISPRGIEEIKKAAQYPAFVDLLDRFPSLRDSFFGWILRDGIDACAFIEFPGACQRIIAAKLSGRIGHHKALKIIHRKEGKQLCLPFEGEYRNILDLQEKVAFRGDYVLTMREIFEVFARKDVAVGNLEFMKDGIINWNVQKLGFWNAISQNYQIVDVNQKDWWKQMPLLEVLSRRKVYKRYGLKVKPHHWIAAAVATRGFSNLNYEETHAFLEIAIPYKDGMYSIYDFGKLANRFPNGAWERLKMFTETVFATVAFPDDNVFYTHRERGFHPFVLNLKQGEALMDSIKRDIERARGASFVYQIESENCAKWVHYKLVEVLGEEKIPDFFRMQLLDTHPQGIIAHLFYWLKKLPACLQVPILMILHLPLGAFRKVWIMEEGQWVPKSLTRHSFFKTGQIFLPALLVHKAHLLSLSENAMSVLYLFFQMKRSIAWDFSQSIRRLKRLISLLSKQLQNLIQSKLLMLRLN